MHGVGCNALCKAPCHAPPCRRLGHELPRIVRSSVPRPVRSGGCGGGARPHRCGACRRVSLGVRSRRGWWLPGGIGCMSPAGLLVLPARCIPGLLACRLACLPAYLLACSIAGLAPTPPQPRSRLAPSPSHARHHRAGNANIDFRRVVPAACAGAIAVTALDAVTRRPAPFSNWLAQDAQGADRYRTLAAPGARIRTTGFEDGLYVTKSGT